MEGANHSVVSEFVFLGLTNSWGIQLLLFVFSSMFYVASMMRNSLIMFRVASESHLHSPMYFLLANLSFIDLGFSSVVSPKMIYDLFRKHKVIFFRGCITQIFFIHVIGGVEMVLLIAMAFDRYVAISNGGFISVGSFLILVTSYIVIILSVQKHSSAGSSKALSTLSAHITVVVLFFIPLIFVYARPSPATHLDKFLAFFDAVLTPFLNPVIYTLRNQEMKVAMRKVCRLLVTYRKIS
ncbi:Olfactory receptor 4F3/4F16/4F29 [Sciurus carolinensis]|uniref:Olfactory receptor 4F3/4F16/4F29 n=1 Tax=Sciurus carolinensis TaxID=30640 RepID=A0AA41MTZ6_SCICA|nr:Olfactory receptor 4F3/4F16/4F29 [Sciurus carolinensis]